MNYGGMLFLVLLILLIIAALPNWWPRHRYGYYPSGLVGILLLVILVLLLLGVIGW